MDRWLWLPQIPKSEASYEARLESCWDSNAIYFLFKVPLKQCHILLSNERKTLLQLLAFNWKEKKGSCSWHMLNCTPKISQPRVSKIQLSRVSKTGPNKERRRPSAGNKASIFSICIYTGNLAIGLARRRSGEEESRWWQRGSRRSGMTCWGARWRWLPAYPSSPSRSLSSSPAMAPMSLWWAAAVLRSHGLPVRSNPNPSSALALPTFSTHVSSFFSEKLLGIPTWVLG